MFFQFRESLRNDIRERILNVTSLGVLQVDANLHRDIRIEGVETSDKFLSLQKTLRKIQSASPNTRDIYTMSRREDGKIIFVAGAEGPSSSVYAPLGAVYDDPGPVLVRDFDAMKRPKIEDGFYTDEYGTWLSAYAPMYTSDGKLEGIFAVDMDVKDVMALEYAFVKKAAVSFAFSLVFMFLLSIFLSTKITKASVVSEAALRESEKRFRDIATSVVDWIWEVDETGKYTYCSEKSTALLGYLPEEVVGKTIFDFMLLSDAESFSRSFKGIVDKKSIIRNQENWYRMKDGKDIYLHMNAVPIVTDEGTFKGYRGVSTDITERKKAEQLLEEKVKILERIV